MFSAPRQSILRTLVIICLVIIRSSSYQVVQEVSGSVGAGEYSLYKVELTSPLALVLVSDRGDGDLYVSLSEEPPTFELYDYASQTCGADVVVLSVMDETARIAKAGVYGHIRYNTTEYRLYLIKCEGDSEFTDVHKIANDPVLMNIIKRLQLSGKGSDESSHFWTSLGDWILWLLINILEFGMEVFL